MSAVTAVEQIWSDNRAVGRVLMRAKFADGATRRDRVAEAGPLRLRCPGPPGRELETVIVNTAGGMAGGDRFEIDIAAGPGAEIVLTTAAAEKVYRTLGPETSVTAKLTVAAGGALAWLPQETILFDRARLRRSIEVDLADDARLLLAEAMVFGRSGMGETITDGFLFDRWRVRRDGRLVHAEGLRVDGAVAAQLAQTAVAHGSVAVATVLLVPGDETAIAGLTAPGQEWRGEVGASAWNDRAVVRLVAADGGALRHDLTKVLAALRGGRLPRLWLQ